MCADKIRRLCINFNELARYIKLPKRAEERLRAAFNCSYKKQIAKSPLRGEIEKLVASGRFSTREEIADHLGLSSQYIGRILNKGS